MAGDPRGDGADARERLVEDQRMLAAIDVFADVDDETRARIASVATHRRLKRGEVLMEQGSQALALHFVISGRFAVFVNGNDHPIAEIGPGQPIGEIGFFTGGKRSAKVVALRDSVTIRLPRDRFEEIVAELPELSRHIIAILAKRLAATNAKVEAAPEPTRPRTVAIVPAGDGDLPDGFLIRLRAVMTGLGRVEVITSETVEALFPDRDVDDHDLADWLNRLEYRRDIVVYAADPSLSSWTEKCLRQADEILLVARAGGDARINEVEARALGLFPPAHRRLVVAHGRAERIATGTAAWLEHREVSMVHHVALDGDGDIARLYRFLAGRAVGFVASGGGALGPAHLGVYKAYEEAGVTFDCFAGTSVGSAMAGALAAGLSPDEINARVGDMFIRDKALGRLTLPLYSLLDHTVFDAALKRHYGEDRIEDLWRPYVAVSSNLSFNRRQHHREGPLWVAIRASAAIPGILPPYYTRSGDMLVDGALMENLPIATMRRLKSGPNLAVSFTSPEPRHDDFDYDDLPGLAGVVRGLLPFTRVAKRAPNVFAVLMRSLLANQRYDGLPFGPTDIWLRPPVDPSNGFLNWARHDALFEEAYRFARDDIERRRETGDPAIAALVGKG